MKKLITILILAIFVFTAFGQKTSTLSAKDPKGAWLIDKYLGTGDTIGTGDSTWYYTIYPNKGERVYYDIWMDIDSIGGTGNVANQVPVILQGRRLSVDPWTAIDTVNYAGKADTTFKFSQVSTASFYTEFKITVTGKSDSFAARFYRIVARFWY